MATVVPVPGGFTGNVTGTAGLTTNVYTRLHRTADAPVIGDTVVGSGPFTIGGLIDGKIYQLWAQTLDTSGALSVASEVFVGVPFDASVGGVLDPFDPLQLAIYERLTGDATLVAKVSGVFDDVPQGQAYPYVTIGDFSSGEWRTHDSPGHEITADIHIWSKAPENKEALDIASDVGRLLGDRTDLSVTGFFLVGVWHQTSEVFKTIDQEKVVTRHVIVSFRVRLQQC